MLNYNDFELSFCIGSLDGRCLRRAAQLGLAVETAVLSSPGKAADVAGLIGPGPDLRCLQIQGLNCPHAPPKPSFKYPLLKVGDEVVREFQRHSKQTKLLEDFESQGWPFAISNQSGTHSELDPENGISDVLYELNRHQESRMHIRFWLVGGGVRWEVIDLARLAALRWGIAGVGAN